MTLKASSGSQLENQEQETDLNDDGGSAGASSFAAALAAQLKDGENGDDEGADDGADTGDTRESGKKVKLDSLDSLAASLGVKVEELYAVKIPAGHGREPMTVGQIKDRFTSFNSLEADRLSLTEERVAQEAEFEQTRAELRELLTVVPKENLSQDALRAAAARVAARNKADGAKLLAAMPEWRDEDRRNEDVAEIAAALGKYGIPASYVGTVRSPALMKFMRDAARREKQVQAALASVKNTPRKKAVVTATGGRPPRITPQQNTGQRPGKPTSARERFTTALRNAT